MNNQAYEPDRTPEGIDPPPYSGGGDFSLVRDEMEALRSRLEPGVYNAPLNHGDMPRSDLYKLLFLIGFPTFFFLLAVILMASDD